MLPKFSEMGKTNRISVDALTQDGIAQAVLAHAGSLARRGRILPPACKEETTLGNNNSLTLARH